MINKSAFYFITLLFFVVSCYAQDVSQGAIKLVVKDDLKDYLLSQHDDIKISEVFSKNSDKKVT